MTCADHIFEHIKTVSHKIGTNSAIKEASVPFFLILKISALKVLNCTLIDKYGIGTILNRNE